MYTLTSPQNINLECTNSSGRPFKGNITQFDDRIYISDVTRYTTTNTSIETHEQAKNSTEWVAKKSWTKVHFSDLARSFLESEMEIRRVSLRAQYRAEQAQKEADRQAFYNALNNLTSSLGVNTNNPSAMLRPTTPAEWATRAPSAGRSSVGDMGGVTYTQAPRMSPQQQAQYDELERFKMREQMARGERPTTFGEDAAAKTAQQNRQIAATRARESAASDQAAADQAREHERREEANRQQELAERKRLADEAAAAEKAQRDRIAAEEAARKKREADAEARAESERKRLAEEAAAAAKANAQPSSTSQRSQGLILKTPEAPPPVVVPQPPPPKPAPTVTAPKPARKPLPPRGRNPRVIPMSIVDDAPDALPIGVLT